MSGFLKISLIMSLFPISIRTYRSCLCFSSIFISILSSFSFADTCLTVCTFCYNITPYDHYFHILLILRILREPHDETYFPFRFLRLFLYARENKSLMIGFSKVRE